MHKQYITDNFEQTQELGFTFSKNLKGGEVLSLYGDLGSGKTTFMQGLAKGLGVNKNIISPTFIIMRTYKVESRNLGIRNLYHVDLYRIEGEEDVQGLGLLELTGNSENIVAIEWPDKIENILPEKRINIYFEYLGNDRRKIRIE